MTTVLLHPVGLDRHTWRHVQTPDGVAVDLPGHGDAPAVRELSWDLLADHVCAQAAGRLDLVGLSLGGMLAQYIAIHRPERVRSLFVACSTAATDAAALLARAAHTERDGMAGVLDSTLARWFTPLALATPGHPGVEYARQRLLADDPAVFAAYWRLMATHDVRAALPSVAVPTTLLAGTDDASTPVTAMREIAGSVPHARLVTASGPHMLPLERAELVTKMIDEHLARVGGEA